MSGKQSLTTRTRKGPLLPSSISKTYRSADRLLGMTHDRVTVLLLEEFSSIRTSGLSGTGYMRKCEK